MQVLGGMMIVCGCLGLGIWYRQQFLGRLHRIRELIAILEQWSSEQIHASGVLSADRKLQGRPSGTDLQRSI